VVVVDLHLPGGDGFGFLRQLRALGPPRAAVPVLALSARGEGARPGVLAAGFDDYLVKPATFPIICDALLRLARRPPVPAGEPR
jgi:DNA-binding response OmpR family regulator